MNENFPNEQESFMGIIVLATSAADEGLESDRIEEACTALMRMRMFRNMSGDEMASMWLNLHNEQISEYGLGEFIDAVAARANGTSRKQLFKICFDLIASNPLLELNANPFLRILVKKFSLRPDAIRLLQESAQKPTSYRRYIDTFFGVEWTCLTDG